MIRCCRTCSSRCSFCWRRALWLAWRVVNVPSFADFLIATEAELNKVSWTTRRAAGPGHHRGADDGGPVGGLPVR